MRILVVAATASEVEGLASGAGEKEPVSGALELEMLTTGVGMVATAFALGGRLALNKYDLAVNLGIAGSFERNIALGEVVEVVEDSLSELGAEDHDAFLTIEDLGFGEGKFTAGAALDDYGNFGLKKCSAITVNTVHGHQASITKLTERLRPQIESMEGAAFFYACKQHAVPCLQIRAVSNYVEQRNRDAWQIVLAVKNLNSFALEFLRHAGQNAR